MTLPPRILVGEAPWFEVLGGAIVTLAAAAALIPLAGADLLRGGAAHGLEGQAARRLARVRALTS